MFWPVGNRYIHHYVRYYIHLYHYIYHKIPLPFPSPRKLHSDNTVARAARIGLFVSCVMLNV